MSPQHQIGSVEETYRAGARYLVIDRPVAPPALLSDLTSTERDVINAWLTGMSMSEIAEQRRVARRTVANQIASAYRKLNVGSRGELQALLQRGHDASEVTEAPEYWQAMVEGRWTLVERFESDGRRVLVARANAPKTREQHALSVNECKVASLVAMCQPSKWVAYELGFPESTVSELLKSAMRKLGVRAKVELVDLHGAMLARCN